MWILLLLWICVTKSVEVSRITLQDTDFVGPDKRLEELLTQRRTVPAHELDALAAITNNTTRRFVPHRPGWMETILPETVQEYAKFISKDRQLYEKFMTALHFNMTKLHEPDFMVVKLLTFLIYNIKARLEDFQPIVKKYEHDERLRFGYMFGKLDQWKKKIMKMYAHGALRLPRVFNLLFYYSRIHATNIDITHTVDFLRDLQEKYIREQDWLYRQKKDISRQEMKRLRLMNKALEKYKGMNFTQEQLLSMEQQLEESGLPPPGALK